MWYNHSSLVNIVRQYFTILSSKNVQGALLEGIIMSKIKYLIALFCATLAIGGTGLVSAYTTAPSLNGLKADFLGNPHYTSNYTKTTWSSQ